MKTKGRGDRRNERNGTRKRTPQRRIQETEASSAGKTEDKRPKRD